MSGSNGVTVIGGLTVPQVPQVTYDLTRYLPQGRIWDKAIGSPMSNAMQALVPTYQRLSDDAVGLLAEAFIGTTIQMLPDFEASLNLPDQCLGLAPTIDQRRAEAVARFTGLGGISPQYYIQYAATLGFPGGTITEYAPFYADINHVGDYLTNVFSAFLWTFNWSGSTTDYAVLVCEFERLRPANTFVDFNITNTLWLIEEQDGSGAFILEDDSGYLMQETD